MKQKNIYIVLLMIICVLGGILVGSSQIFSKDEVSIIKDEHQTKSYSSAISMMYETSAGSGIYEESKSTSWPQEGYTFNITLSKCENGSTLTWDDSAKAVKMTGNVSDKCYVYFDVKPTLASVCNNKNLAQCIKDNYTLDSNIYYHQPSLANGAGDNSYRYAGSYESVENYVCMGDDVNGNCPYDKLYRIIGVFGNQVKLIKADYAKASELGTGGDYKSLYQVSQNGSEWGTNKGNNKKTEIGGYYWNYNNGSDTNANIWANSQLNTVNLNQTYLNTLGTTWAAKIATTNWKVGGNTYGNIEEVVPATAYQNEIVSSVTGQPAVNSKIGLMYVSDYGFAAEPSAWQTNLGSYHSSDIRTKNWMYNGLHEWTISRSSDYEFRAFAVYYVGRLEYSFNVYTYGFAVRPVFYLISTVTKTSGDGTFSNPYRIS